MGGDSALGFALPQKFFVKNLFYYCTYYANNEMKNDYAFGKFVNTNTRNYYEWLCITFDMITEMEQRVSDCVFEED